MAYSKFTTFISGFNTCEVQAPLAAGMTPEQQLQVTIDSEAFMKAHFVQTRRAGQLKPETVRKIAAQMGIVRGLRAEAVSFDGSGKGRHAKRIIAV